MKDETAWLIERDDLATMESREQVCLHYYAEWMKGRHWWTPDHMKAKRFPDEETARAEANGDPLLRVVEHMWIGGITPPEVGGELERVMAQVPQAYADIKLNLSDVVICYGMGDSGCVREGGCEDGCLMLATYRKGVEFGAIAALSTPEASDGTAGLVEAVQAFMTRFGDRDVCNSAEWDAMEAALSQHRGVS